MSPGPAEYVATALFALAVAHTFSTRLFERLARARPAHAGAFHLLGEVEIAFGFWAMLLVAALFVIEGPAGAVEYVDSRNFAEPLFVFVVMVVAGTRPILRTVGGALQRAARLVPLRGAAGFCLLTLALAPLLGSFITEPAAMTLAALMLAERIFSRGASPRLKYAVLGTLFVNVSIGGTLTPFAAPPVLMVAGAWGWNLSFMLATFGGKAALAVLANALGVTLLFRRELAGMSPPVSTGPERPPVPAGLTLVHFGLLLGMVVFAHHPAIFMGLFLFFLGVASAYKSHEDPLILREGLLVAFFLAGLVVLGGLQGWWLRPLLLRLSERQVFFGAAALTAFTDNAALTYLGSLAPGLSEAFKYALVAGAVTGGGLTVIANAPNPAGLAILRGHFPDEAVSAPGLLLAALPPTLVAGAAFLLL